MEVAIALLIIAVGSFGQSSSYVPINKIKVWHWESFWLVQGVFAWLIFPFMGARLGVPVNGSLISLWGQGNIFPVILYGMLWGIGGLTFGLSMRYLGVALGQSVALGTCSAFGTLLPALSSGTDLFRGQGLLLLVGVAVTLAGIVTIGYAGRLRSINMSEEARLAAVKEFALTKGLFVALLCGVMSACFALGIDAGSDIKSTSVACGVDPIYAGLPVIVLITGGGFLTNAVYCLWQNVKNRTFTDYKQKGVRWNNLFFCVLAGLLWYSQFFGLEMGKSFLTGHELLLAFSWSILMALNVMFSNVWGILLKEWKGCSLYTVAVLIAGLVLLVSSIVLVAVVQQ